VGHGALPAERWIRGQLGHLVITVSEFRSLCGQMTLLGSIGMMQNIWPHDFDRNHFLGRTWSLASGIDGLGGSTWDFVAT
jgi:hypothetical protein